MKIKMLTSYRDFYQSGDVVEETKGKAAELVKLGRAEYVVDAAPMNKEVQTAKVVVYKCEICDQTCASERGLKIHTTRLHK